MKKLIVIILVIVFNTSMAQDMDPQVTDPEMNSVKTKVLKLELFSPLSGNLTLGYENYVNKGMSWETKIGIIGAGKNIENQKGIFAKIGPKFKLTPDYILKGMISSHPLRGSYVKPELVVNYFSTESIFEYQGYGQEKQNRGGGALLINFGKQFVLGGKMSLDWSIGVGYGFGNQGHTGYQYGFLSGGSGFPFAISSGFTLGILI